MDRRKLAVVNVVFRDILGRRELLFIRRRDNPFDPWRGDVGFPGGGSLEGEDPIVTALRETWEEVGISPSSLDVLGVYGYEKTPIIPGLRVAIVLSRLKDPRVEFKPAWDEVSEVFWVRIDDIVGPVRLFHPFKGIVVEAYIADNHIVWGFTKRVLNRILLVLRQL